MAGRLITAVGVLLALLIVVGTALYVRGITPPFPWNAWAFNGMVLLTMVFALVFGRR